MIKKKKEVSGSDILSFKEVCKLLKITQPTFWRRLSDKRLPGKIYGKKVGGVWRIQRKDIYAYLNEEKRITKFNDFKDNDILNFDEACKLLKITPPSLENIISNSIEPGKIYGKKVGRAWKIQRKDVYRYLNGEDNNKDNETR